MAPCRARRSAPPRSPPRSGCGPRGSSGRTRTRQGVRPGPALGDRDRARRPAAALSSPGSRRQFPRRMKCGFSHGVLLPVGYSSRITKGWPGRTRPPPGNIRIPASCSSAGRRAQCCATGPDIDVERLSIEGNEPDPTSNESPCRRSSPGKLPVT
jgi:hypothetical protein